MSSTHRGHMDIPMRTRFLYSVGSTTYYVVKEGKQAKAIMSQAEFTDILEELGSPGINYLYRDMGKEINIVGSNGMRIETYRLVQHVNGSTTEGVADDHPAYDTYYVRTWSATGGTTVVRTG